MGKPSISCRIDRICGHATFVVQGTNGDSRAMVRTATARKSAAHSKAPPSPITTADRRAQGKALRDKVARDEHAVWRATNRTTPIAILRAADTTRQQELV